MQSPQTPIIALHTEAPMLFRVCGNGVHMGEVRIVNKHIIKKEPNINTITK